MRHLVIPIASLVTVTKASFALPPAFLLSSNESPTPMNCFLYFLLITKSELSVQFCACVPWNLSGNIAGGKGGRSRQSTVLRLCCDATMAAADDRDSQGCKHSSYHTRWNDKRKKPAQEGKLSSNVMCAASLPDASFACLFMSRDFRFEVISNQRKRASNNVIAYSRAKSGHSGMSRETARSFTVSQIN